MRKIIKQLFRLSGFELNRINREESLSVLTPGSVARPIGSMQFLLEDLRFRGLRCNSIIDVGANRTNWSKKAVAVYPEATFCLIEPQIEMEPYLVQFCNNHLGSTYLLAGAGASEETLTLTVWDDLDGSSFLPTPSTEKKAAGKQREIEILTIDRIIQSKQIETPELIKLDIQGFELEALKGAEKTFGYTEVYVLEVSLFPFGDLPNQPLFADVIQFMLDRDYVVYDFPGFLRRPFDGALGQCDICFVKRNGFLRASNAWS